MFGLGIKEGINDGLCRLSTTIEGLGAMSWLVFGALISFSYRAVLYLCPGLEGFLTGGCIICITLYSSTGTVLT